MQEDSGPGTPVAGLAGMARRVSAMIGIVVVIGLALVLMWRVYLHHQRSGSAPDEPALVHVISRAA